MMRQRNARSRLQCHTFADFLHNANDFVAQLHGTGYSRRIHLHQVGAADAAAVHTYQCLAYPDRRNRHLRHFHHARRGGIQPLHALVFVGLVSGAASWALLMIGLLRFEPPVITRAFRVIYLLCGVGAALLGAFVLGTALIQFGRGG